MHLPIMQDALVRKRDGRVAPFDPSRIERAILAAFAAELNVPLPAPLPDGAAAVVQTVFQGVLDELLENASPAPALYEVEQIQDLVERRLMREGHFAVARRYIVYREEHARARRLREAAGGAEDGKETPRLVVRTPEGVEGLDLARLERRLRAACEGIAEACPPEELSAEVQRQLFDGICPTEIARAMILAARARIERDPDYDMVAARLMLAVIYHEALGEAARDDRLAALSRRRFVEYLDEGMAAERLAGELRSFDLAELAGAIRPERDSLFRYLGLQTLYDRYLLHIDGRRIETPQYFWMRVAMGLAIGEGEDRTLRAIEFYNVLSTFRFTSATPTLFNAGTPHPQLSSCYLTTVRDDLAHIFKAVSDNALLSKWAGGLGNDWTNVRATNAHIRGTNGRSQGVIPFLKVVSDAAVAVNQGGKRKGAVCAYLETWHLDIEEFLDLRKNTGDERRRTHDMHTAHWIPDLFMRRVIEEKDWTLFSPDEVPDLHDLVGRAFERRYEEYERMVDDGRIKLFRRLPAVQLWRKMLTRLFETGHPWLTWKDPSNLRSPQDHAGVVHSSNLCTEILLNTSADETAVCNLGSVNLAAHVTGGKLDLAALETTVRAGVRMLDNVIDINYYPTPEAARSNRRHRPIGLGIMGYQDALAALGLGYASEAAVEFADRSMEAVSCFALLASSELARQRGRYESYPGSKWDRGLLPLDTIGLLEEERGVPVAVDRHASLDWTPVRAAIARDGMRNSNVLAIAPTATISTIIGVTQSIEPVYSHLFVKSNLSGDFVQVNVPLVRELKERGLWDADMLEALKYHDGSLAEIDRVPGDIKARYQTAFEIDPRWLIDAAARRQKWIDMGQSLNLYLADPSGRKLHDMYLAAWLAGLKTTYYLRTRAATQVEKSTVDVNRFGIQPKWMKSRSASSEIQVPREPAAATTACHLEGDCDACQ
jgi:ribonucleoside-diphosphate reductase alpha chain